MTQVFLCATHNHKHARVKLGWSNQRPAIIISDKTGNDPFLNHVIARSITIFSPLNVSKVSKASTSSLFWSFFIGPFLKEDSQRKLEMLFGKQVTILNARYLVQNMGILILHYGRVIFTSVCLVYFLFVYFLRDV